METIRIINFIITAIFAVCYSYQFLYVPVSLWFQGRDKRHMKNARSDADNELCERHLKRYAVLISARNEENVIGQLIDSINNQTYKGEITTFVMADNCTDNTYGVAVDHGAVAYTRKSTKYIGKGYAIEMLLKHIKYDYPLGFDGYFVFDADNILSPTYIEEMHKCHLAGNDAITSYRAAKNYGDNWISSGYGLWFLRESMYLNYSRYRLGSSAAISGTGFFFSDKVLKDIGGWPFHLLTEDIEFTINQVCKGVHLFIIRLKAKGAHDAVTGQYRLCTVFFSDPYAFLRYSQDRCIAHDSGTVIHTHQKSVPVEMRTLHGKGRLHFHDRDVMAFFRPADSAFRAYQAAAHNDNPLAKLFRMQLRVYGHNDLI